jgi:hypothetical protein
MHENYKLCCVESGVRKKALPTKTWIRVRVDGFSKEVITGIGVGLQIEAPNPDLCLREPYRRTQSVRETEREL